VQHSPLRPNAVARGVQIAGFVDDPAHGAARTAIFRSTAGQKQEDLGEGIHHPPGLSASSIREKCRRRTANRARLIFSSKIASIFVLLADRRPQGIPTFASRQNHSRWPVNPSAEP
jgi:hypothetical protein